MFGFDERYAMFDITPVENQFILEYLPQAKGDYVRVYLYGLMHCYHPQEDMSPERMAHELNMTADEIQAAFRYWERRGIVRRVSDKPPKWQYANLKEINLHPEEPPVDPDYASFSKAVYEAFDHVRRLHGSELSECFDWHEELKLPTEVVIMLLNHMVEVKGRNFRISEAGRIAVQMAEEKISTIEDAEAFFSRDELCYEGARKILRKLGKRYAPSEAQTGLYRKWVAEWHFTHDAIEEACALTAGGNPSMAYLDGILSSLRQNADAETRLDPAIVRDSTRRTEEFRDVLKQLGNGEINQRSLAMYDRMKELYPQAIILTAARECGHNGKGLQDVLKLLESWKEKGFQNEKEVDEYVRLFHEQTALIRELHSLWGTDEKRIGKTDRSMVSRWQNELEFSRDTILAAARFASEAKLPMAYLDRILTDYSARGIRTPEAVELDRKKGKDTVPSGGKPNGKTVSAQLYDQREYTPVQEQLMEKQRKEIEELLHRDGGSFDA